MLAVEEYVSKFAFKDVMFLGYDLAFEVASKFDL